MKMELLKSGCLKIVLSDEELAAAGLSYATMSGREGSARAALQRLLLLAHERVNFPLESAVTVESIPLDGGCLLLLSPGAREKRRRPPKPRVFASGDIGDFFALAAARPEDIASLYRFEGRFFLVYYGERADLVAEFLLPEKRDALAPETLEEYGVCLATGDALQRLFAAQREDKSD